MYLLSTCAPSTKPKPYGPPTQSQIATLQILQTNSSAYAWRKALLIRKGLYTRVSILLPPSEQREFQPSVFPVAEYGELRYRGRSLPTSNPPDHLAESEVPMMDESEVPTMDNRRMLEPQLSSSRSKRQRSEPPRLNKTSQAIWKKWRLSRLSHPSGSQPTSAFWDNLSEIWLTKRES